MRRACGRPQNPAAVYTPELRTDISEIWLGGGEVLAIVTDDGDSTDDECGGVGSHEAKEAERVMKEEAAAARSIATATPEPAEERLPHTELSPTAAGAGGEETPAGEVVIDLTTVTAQKKLGKHLRKAPLGLGESGGACSAARASGCRLGSTMHVPCHIRARRFCSGTESHPCML